MDYIYYFRKLSALIMRNKKKKEVERLRIARIIDVNYCVCIINSC